MSAALVAGLGVAIVLLAVIGAKCLLTMRRIEHQVDSDEIMIHAIRLRVQEMEKQRTHSEYVQRRKRGER